MALVGIELEMLVSEPDAPTTRPSSCESTILRLPTFALIHLDAPILYGIVDFCVAVKCR